MTDDIEYKDLLGINIKIGTPVAYSDGRALCIGIVDKFTPKMVKIIKCGKEKKYRSTPTVLKYPTDVVVVDEKSVTMYFLRG